MQEYLSMKSESYKGVLFEHFDGIELILSDDGHKQVSLVVTKFSKTVYINNPAYIQHLLNLVYISRLWESGVKKYYINGEEQ